MEMTEQLVQAAGEGQCERVRWLLENGVEVDAPHKRRTALDLAVVNDHPGIVRILLDAGADPEQTVGEYHESLPLRFAAARGKTELVHELLVAGARPDGRLGEQQYTALSIASAEGHLEIVEELLAHGANLNWLGDPDSHPLGGAAFAGNVPIVHLLLNRGAAATPEALESVRRGKETAQRQAKMGLRSTSQLADLAACHEEIASLLERAINH